MPKQQHQHTHQVTYSEKGVPGHQYFHCTADDNEHAKEQCKDAYPHAKIHKVDKLRPMKEDVQMTTTLVEFAENKDALGFQAALHERIRERVSGLLDTLREKIAAELFGENAIDTPGSPREGGIAGVTTSDRGLPSVKSGVKFPGKKDGGNEPQGAGPDKSAGALDPNSAEFDRKGSTDTPHPIPANETVAHANKDAPDQNKNAKDPNSSEFNRKGKVRIPANESKWLQSAVHPSRVGMFAGRSLASLEKEKAHLESSGPHTHGSEGYTRMHQLEFAISRKQRHGA